MCVSVQKIFIPRRTLNLLLGLRRDSVHDIYDANDKAHGYGASVLIHGLWYRYCEKCGTYHALMSNVELADKSSVSPVKKYVQGRRSGGGRGKLMLVKPQSGVSNDVS